MSLNKELSKENLLEMALHGTRGVLQRELDIKQVVFTMTNTPKKDIARRAGMKDQTVPYSYIVMNSLAGIRETQNNFAVRKHGMCFNSNVGEQATSKKGYLFSVTLGLELHYVDSDQKRLLSLAQALALLSLTNGLNFRIDVGTLFYFVVRLEVPLDVPIGLQDADSTESPGATDITTQIVMHTQVGFLRDVSAVNGRPPVMNVTVMRDDRPEETFEIGVPDA